MGKKVEFMDMFQDLSFTDIFDTFDDEYLTSMAHEKPGQLKRMCLFLSLDGQLLKEKYHKESKNKNKNKIKL